MKARIVSCLCIEYSAMNKEGAREGERESEEDQEDIASWTSKD